MLEGILAATRHTTMISRLLQDHRGHSFVYYLDVSIEETLRRHTTRPQATEFSGEDMRGWYLPRGPQCLRASTPAKLRRRTW